MAGLDASPVLWKDMTASPRVDFHFMQYQLRRNAPPFPALSSPARQIRVSCNAESNGNATERLPRKADIHLKPLSRCRRTLERKYLRDDTQAAP